MPAVEHSKSNKTLHIKIAFSFVFFMFVIVSMAGIVIIERKRLVEIEKNTSNARKTHWDIYYAHQYITRLAMLGESVVSWNCSDFEDYHRTNLMVDSILQGIGKSNPPCVSSEHIDTLRKLLHSKERHLFLLMKTFHRQAKSDSLLITGLHTMNSHTINGFSKNVKPCMFSMPQLMELKDLNEDLIRTQEARMYDFEDISRRIREDNTLINTRLINLIAKLDTQVRKIFQEKECDLNEMRRTSLNLISGIIVITCILLIFAYLLIRRDVIQRIEIRKQLEESLRQNKTLLDMREKVLLTVSHDIRGPLNTITGSAELALNTRDRKKRNSYLGNILDSSHHILKLVNNLLDLSRLNQSKETPNIVPFRLDELMKRIVSTYSHKANEKGLMFRYTFNGLSVAVLNDPDRIEQILDNLVSNAIKFTLNGSIDLKSSYNNGVFFVQVQDTGIGMSKKTMERMFTPFERSATEISAEGFGLGLSITKGLINLLGGKISVSSIQGEGSSFEISIPMNETVLDKKEQVTVKEFSGIFPKRVIAIDDDPLQLAVMKEMLERNGVECITCKNPKEVVTILRTGDSDILLTDIQMPGTSGKDLLTLLRSANIGNSREIPIAAMTARDYSDDEATVKSGFVGCIHKPFSMHELLSFLSAIYEDTGNGKETIDFSALIENVSDKKSVLEIFINETHKTQQELHHALKMNEWSTISELLHRISPTFKMIGADKKLQHYREAIKKCNQEVRTEYITNFIRDIDNLIKKAGDLLRKIKINDETENSDSRR